MGRIERRFWDGHEQSSRPAGHDDDPGRVFGAFVPHTVSQWAPILDAETRELVHHAEQCLGALEEAIPRDAALPYEWLLRRAESAASSTIEGVHPSARRLARAEAQLTMLREAPKADDLEALRNIAATDRAIALGQTAEDLSVEGVCAVHATLMGKRDPTAGHVRSAQSWISARAFSTPLDASYVPPPAAEVPRLMEDLTLYVNTSRESPLVKLAVAHAQFEAIHPFADGNGRTGRALMHLMLRKSGLVSSCTAPLSSSLAMKRSEYLDALNAFHVVCGETDPARSAAFRPWLLLLAESAIDATSYARRVIDHVSDIRSRWQTQVSELGLRRNNPAWRLLDLLPRHPVLTTPYVMELLGTEKHTALRSLNALERAGVLVQRSAGRRNRVHEAAAITDAFAALASVRPGEHDIRLPASTPLDTEALAATHGQQPDAGRDCDADTTKGGKCKHPRPRPGGQCPAGHERP